MGHDVKQFCTVIRCCDLDLFLPIFCSPYIGPLLYLIRWLDRSIADELCIHHMFVMKANNVVSLRHCWTGPSLEAVVPEDRTPT